MKGEENVCGVVVPLSSHVTLGELTSLGFFPAL